jgi:hypothetical protein
MSNASLFIVQVYINKGVITKEKSLGGMNTFSNYSSSSPMSLFSNVKELASLASAIAI